MKLRRYLRLSAAPVAAVLLVTAAPASAVELDDSQAFPAAASLSFKGTSATITVTHEGRSDTRCWTDMDSDDNDNYYQSGALTTKKKVKGTAQRTGSKTYKNVLSEPDSGEYVDAQAICWDTRPGYNFVDLELSSDDVMEPESALSPAQSVAADGSPFGTVAVTTALGKKGAKKKTADIILTMSDSTFGGVCILQLGSLLTETDPETGSEYISPNHIFEVSTHKARNGRVKLTIPNPFLAGEAGTIQALVTCWNDTMLFVSGDPSLPDDDPQRFFAPVPTPV